MAFTLVASNTDLNTTATIEVIVQSHGSSAGPVNGPLNETDPHWFLDSRLRFNQSEDAAAGQGGIQHFENNHGQWVRRWSESAGVISFPHPWVKISDYWECS